MTDSLTWLRDPAAESAESAEIAASVVTRLARGTGPATALFEELAGEPVRIDLTGNAYRLLTPAECLDLGISPGAYGYQRNGTLRTVNSGLVAAEVSSVVVPDRLPPAARRALSMSSPDDLAPVPSVIPLGTVLADLGVRREPLAARLTCSITSVSGRHTLVESWARMWLGDKPVALASERVTTEFCQRVGQRKSAASGDPAVGIAPVQGWC
jgi:hypothetical protein